MSAPDGQHGSGYGGDAAHGSASGYGVPGHPGPGYGPPPGYGYGPPPGWSPVPPSWPHGPGRPGVATAAAVLGFITGGLTVLASLGFVVGTLSDGGDVATTVLMAGLPCGVAMLVGAGMLLARRPLPVLALGCVAALVVLAVAWGAFVAGDDGADPAARAGITAFTVGAGVLPVVTLVFSLLGDVRSWLAAPS